MFNNARHFNEVGSQIYCDANTLSSLTKGFVRQAGNGMDNPRVMKDRVGCVPDSFVHFLLVCDDARVGMDVAAMDQKGD